MSFKSIVNNSLVNLNNCEDEPIHVPGSIQPHGFLISLDFSTHIITVCSENVFEFIGISYEQLLGKNIATVFDQSFIEEISLFKDNTVNSIKTFNYSFNDTDFSINLHSSTDQIIIEGEPLRHQFNENNDLYSSSRQLLSYIEGTFTLKELADVVAIAIKNITKYDRVMVYRFDENYNGEVIAESKENHLQSYLGLHYPHTDIPVQARALYIKNHLRIIGDVSYSPVPLYKLNKDTFETLDLSLSVLRSVSPIHIEYLKNMEVGATLTISLIHKDKLWGLITCHHYSPKFLSHEIRSAVKLHGHFITSQIDVRMMNEEFGIATKTNNALNELISKKLDIKRDSIAELLQNEAILKLCNSVGFTAVIANKVYHYGTTPSDENSKRLAIFLAEYTKEETLQTDSLVKISTDLTFISNDFPGINYYSLKDDADCLIWYRTHTIKEINWAGNPDKAIEKVNDRLSPRKSFAMFTESVKDASRMWLKSEINACNGFFNYFQIHLRSILLNEEKEIQKKLTEILEETNAELENINWISTHDLQEPLRKIRMMASVLVGGNELKVLPEDVQSKIIKIQSSAERMQNLIADILKYTKTGAQNSNFEEINLNHLLSELRDELGSTLIDYDATLIIEDLPKIQGIPFLLKQLFLNIINNSLKFQGVIDKSVIRISDKTNSSTLGPNKYKVIEIEDNGIGFDNEYKDKIFKIFARLNNKDTYEGSGIGLALCKKIMIKHNGLITADGELGTGVKITLYFPVA
jgi:light-regulated signal transduction histidine kinase (bacteriophytochrome)